MLLLLELVSHPMAKLHGAVLIGIQFLWIWTHHRFVIMEKYALDKRHHNDSDSYRLWILMSSVEWLITMWTILSL